MGEAAGRGSDYVVVTTDNPRAEDPAAIAEAAAAGVRRTEAEFVIELDRRAAILTAIRAARPGDVVVILGKGAEAEQVWADSSIPFDDRIVAAAAAGVGMELTRELGDGGHRGIGGGTRRR